VAANIANVEIEYDGAGATDIVASNVEDINFTLGSGGDTVNVTTSLAGTSVSLSTISIAGGAGADTVDASAIDAAHPVRVSFNGAGGSDDFTGGAGADIFIGGADGDTGDGGGGNDQLSGGAGSDTLFGDAGDDQLVGGDAADTLAGGPGNDTLLGGNGDDLFVFNLGDGAETITDFSEGPGPGDVIDLVGFSFTDVSELSISDAGIDLLIDLGGGDSIRLVGKAGATLDNDDFDF
jgi:Ca2+-binding RTX toxin-like protein